MRYTLFSQVVDTFQFTKCTKLSNGLVDGLHWIKLDIPRFFNNFLKYVIKSRLKSCCGRDLVPFIVIG